MLTNETKIQENGMLKMIDQSHDPHVDPWLSFAYWVFFVYRHYRYGHNCGYADNPDDNYGPPEIVNKLRSLEKKIAKQSERFGEGKTLDVPIVKASDIDYKGFQKVYLSSNTPVLLKGMAKEWKCVKEWTPEYFKENYGNTVVPTRLHGDSLKGSALRYVHKTMAEVVDNIRQGGTYYPGHVEDIFNQNPELRKHLDLKTLGLYLSTLKNPRIQSTQIFISAGNIISGFHATGGPNLFVMVYGHKDWTFVHPKYSMWMHPITRKDMFYTATQIPWLKSHAEIDAAGFPLYKYVTKYRANLEPGDVLFSPHWWWHCVNTTEPSIAVATRAVNKFILGQPLFSWMWVTSKTFRRMAFNFLKTGWGSDATSGAKLAFEQEFISKVMV